MESKSMPFLVTEIYINDKNELELRKYRKLTNSDVILNYKHAVTPKNINFLANKVTYLDVIIQQALIVTEKRL